MKIILNVRIDIYAFLIGEHSQIYFLKIIVGKVKIVWEGQPTLWEIFQFFVFSEYSNFKWILTFIQQQDNLVESLEEVHIFVAVILNLVEQDNLRLGIGSKGPKQSSVLKIRKKIVIIQNANKIFSTS